MSANTYQYHLLQIGVGQVGGTLRRQILERREAIKRTQGLDLVYCGLFTDVNGLFDAAGLPDEAVGAFPGKTTADLAASIEQLPLPFVVIDTTASPDTAPLLERALARGGSVVAANKLPFAGSQANFDALRPFIGRRLFFETAVGAGLPVIGPLQTLLATGDEVVEIQGCFSGTLGFLFAQMEGSSTFSQAVAEAKRLGFTEPNPRDDLSGADVARKALILARLLGRKLELSDIKLEKLYPASLDPLAGPQFMDALPSLDAGYRSKIEAARRDGHVLRYVATVRPDSCRVGLQAVASASDIGALTGPDNIVVIKTKRYFDNPLVIKGPGAGAAVTAAGVFGDVLQAANRHE